MPILQVKIESFRNIAALQCELAKGLNVFEGDNAQGKTNFLEAVYFLINGKSFRSVEAGSLIQWGCEQSYLEVLFLHEDLQALLQTCFSPKERETRFQGKPVKGLKEIHRRLRVLAFTPDSTALFRGAPALRRRYFDHAAGVHQASYAARLSRYLRALKQRNQLLETGGRSALWTEFNEAWAQEAFGLMQERVLYLEALRPFWRQRLAQMVGKEKALEVRWQGPFWETQPFSVERILEYAASHARLELRMRRTAWGPHRDDLSVELDGKKLREAASQGQQRMMVIALKLAEADLFQKATGRAPVFLLDDLGSELDPMHLGRLLQMLMEIDAQTLLTTAQAGTYHSLQARSFRLAQGELTPAR